MDNYDLKMIKDKYGEKMMHLCREYFPTLLDTEGLLFKLLSNNFAYSKFLYDDITKSYCVDEFVSYINSKYKEKCDVSFINRTPEQLLASVGYKLYECRTQEELDSFRKYYRKNEELCTFAVDRLKTHYVFFIVKDNVDEIKRENFPNPQREDEYSTSVLSIQFTRGTCNRVSIKSRYNHTVKNPDATYYNNLENIVPGLTKSFERKYWFDINGVYDDGFILNNYVRASDGVYYRYNYKINNIYYCINNVIIVNGHVIDYYQAMEKYLLVDYFIIDLENREVALYDPCIIDSFPEYLKEITKIEIYKDKDTDEKYIYITQPENIIMISVNKYNQIIGYHNETVTKIANNFLIYNETLKEMSLPNVRKIGKCFLCHDCTLDKMYAPNLRKLGSSSLLLNHNSEMLEVKKLIKKR